MGADLQRQLPELHGLHHLRMDERAVPRQGIRHRRGRERLHHQRRAHRHQQPAAVISGSDTDLGSFTTTPPSYEYTVTDADGHQVTVVEKLDTTTLRTYTATLGDTNELEITADQWLKLLNGDHALTITATDAKNESTVRTPVLRQGHALGRVRADRGDGGR